jgi:low-affinity ferrous iron transport protein
VRISTAISDFCGKAGVSLGSVILVFLLITTASILKWSETGQLLCNTPTMIIEGFLLLVRIQAHNVSSAARGKEFSGILKRRVLLNYHVNSVTIVEYKRQEIVMNSNRFSVLPNRTWRMFFTGAM